MFLGVIKNNFRRKEADTLARVCVEQLPDAASQDGANKDVRVENDHLNVTSASRDAAV